MHDRLGCCSGLLPEDPRKELNFVASLRVRQLAVPSPLRRTESTAITELVTHHLVTHQLVTHLVHQHNDSPRALCLRGRGAHARAPARWHRVRCAILCAGQAELFDGDDDARRDWV